MSKVSKVISAVASVVAVVATFIPGGQPIAAIAGAVAATAGTVSQITAKQKRPGAQGAVNGIVIGSNMPIPYAVGRTFVAGSQVYEDSGGTNGGGVPNAVRQSVRVLTGAGPIDSFQTFLADFEPITFAGGFAGGATGFYANVLDNQVRYGLRPETAHDYALSPMPNWGSAHKLSGFASYRVAMWFDKTGDRYSGGVPQFGMIGKWVKVYDPRKDSTYPGGSGPHRWDDESTWEWSENGALHALTYARGRFIEKNADGSAKVPPVKILGCGFAKEAIEIADFVEAANLADANEWTCGGLIFDGSEIGRWDNLKRFCETFAAQPVISGGRLRLKLFAPRPSLFTLTEADLAGPIDQFRAMKPFQDRHNSVVYRYRSEAHRWEHVQGEAVTISTYLADDGALRTEEVTYDLVQDKDQAAQLATAKLVLDRQFGPLVVTCKPRLMRFRPGEAGTVTLPELGLNGRKMVIVGRQVDPATGTVTLTFESEPEENEYLFALDRSGTAPPTPVIRGPEEVDQSVVELNVSQTSVSQLIRDSYAKDLTFSVSAPSGSDVTVTISAHERVYTDKIVSVAGATFTVAAASGDAVLIYYDDAQRTGGAVTYGVLVVPGATGPTEAAANSPDNPFRHSVAAQIVPATGSTSGGTDAGSGGGGSGWNRYQTLEQQQ